MMLYYFSLEDERFKDKRANLWLSHLAFLGIFGLNMIFYQKQKQFASMCESGKRLASDYTVMIGNVRQSDDDNILTEFINSRTESLQFDKVKIVKINRAGFEGNQ